jgi:DNA-directed RNA polymerase alpha subunit
MVVVEAVVGLRRIVLLEAVMVAVVEVEINSPRTMKYW